MDSSPEPSKPTNSTSSPLSDPIQVQESPVFSYISKLSPIKPDKAAPVAQGFPGINSPPLVFRSPQINPNRQPTFLKRSQCARLSDARSSGHYENFVDTVTVAEESGRSISHLRSELKTCSQKAFVSNDSPPEKTSSPSECADDYLTLIENMDAGASACSENLTRKSSPDIFQSQDDMFESKESVERTRDKDDTRKDEKTTRAPSVILEQAAEADQRNSLSDLKSVEDDKSGNGNVQPDLCSKVESDSLADLENQHGGRSKAENAGSGHMSEVGCTSLLGSPQIAQGCGSCHENSGVPCAQNRIHDHSSKVVQLQHGISRRSLQFEDAQSKLMASFHFQNSSGTAGHPRSPPCPDDTEVLELASLNKPASPSNRLLANMTEPTFSPKNSGTNNMKVPRRSGIGLHLNSIVNSMQMGSGAKISMKSEERGSLDRLGKKSISITSCHLHKNGPISSNVEDGLSVNSDDSRHDTHASIQASSATALSPYSMKPLYEAVLLKPIELQSNPSNKMKANSETSDSFEEFSQSSLKMKRKKTLDAGDSNSCKRCNCKKTKCLKLYCDCFAAGIYCAEPCACQGCFNRPEYEDTVLETRQQIESRNPLAFAPKIIQHITEAPTNVCADDGPHNTPSSARHKRGCNCKKSKCLKKYCECYQANVGCSDGCRCEGCENVYGRKEEYSMIKDMASKQDDSEKMDSSFDNKLETVASKDGLLQNPHNLTPITPSFQCSNHGKGALKAWFSSGRHLPSPDSGLTSMAAYGMSPGTATNPENHDRIVETNTPIMDLVTFDEDLHYGKEHTVNQFSPRCDVPSNAGHFTSLPNQQDWTNTSRPQMLPGNCQVSSASSLCWSSSPITPSTHFGGTKLDEVVDFDGGLYNIMNDDTPEILKESSMPPNAVKVSSPNKKRVSPPHGRGTEIGSSSSAGMRTGRKFILQAVPPFPPLTPCIESNDGGGHNITNSQNSSSGK